MIPREFFENASREDLRFIHRWSLGVSAFYGVLALALVLVSFVIHGGSSGTASASNPPDVSHAVLTRD